MNTHEIIQKEVRDAMNSGLYSIASLDMFDVVSKLEMTENLELHLDYTNELLTDYLSELMELSNSKPGLNDFLKALKSGDIFDNHKLEKENSFMVELYSQIYRETAIGRLIKYYKNNRELTGKDIFSIHQTLLNGTLSEGVKSVRTVNDKFVGRFVNHERVIDYFPIDYKDVREAANKIAELYNSRLSGDIYDNVFVQSFLIHGLIAALQIFSDGNTRMARVMQHALIWQLINEKTEFNFEMPPVYATRSYYPFRGKYRDMIANLVISGNNDAWNDWFDFNLNRIEDSIYVGRENIKILRR